MPTACCMSAPPDLQLFGFRATTFDSTFLPHSLLTVAFGVSGYVWRRLTFCVDSMLDDTPRLLIGGG